DLDLTASPKRKSLNRKSVSSLATIPETKRPASRAALLRIRAHERMPPSLQINQRIGLCSRRRMLVNFHRLPALSLRLSATAATASSRPSSARSPSARNSGGQRSSESRKQTKGSSPISAKPAFRAAAAPPFD